MNEHGGDHSKGGKGDIRGVDKETKGVQRVVVVYKDSRSSWFARRRRIEHIRRRGIKKQNGRQRSSTGGKRSRV